MTILGELKKRKSHSSSKRRGRGFGSGKGGHTTGSGTKGQKSRSGGTPPIWFEGGQTPLVKRLPYKRGFYHPNRKKVLSINLRDLFTILKKEMMITPDVLSKHGIKNLGKFSEIKILSKGELNKKVSFKGFSYSKFAKKKIESTGGKAE